MIEYWDNPEMDATDGAHPAWWRGHDYTSAQFATLVTKWLDEDNDGFGVHYEPWKTIRERIYALKVKANG